MRDGYVLTRAFLHAVGALSAVAFFQGNEDLFTRFEVEFVSVEAKEKRGSLKHHFPELMFDLR